jgi:hypothetical protein
VTGDVTLEDPVGTPVKHGFDLAFSEPWEQAPNADWKRTLEHAVVCSSEIALSIRNDGVVAGAPAVIETVEVYRFGDDGSLLSRIYWEIPTGSEYGEWTTETGEVSADPVASLVMTPDEMRTFFTRGHELWNAHDVDAWIAHWGAVVSDDYTMEDPVGTAPKHGFEACRVGPWYLFNSVVQLQVRKMMVCGNDVALVVDNTTTIDGVTSTATSIETYAFGAYGSMHERNYWAVQEGAEALMAQYYE